MTYNTQVETEELDTGHPAFSRPSILRTISKRKVQILFAWLVLTGAAIVIVRLLPAVYLAEAVILIDSQKIPEKFVGATVQSELEERIASIRQLLLSGGQLKKIIEDFGLYREERKTHFEEEILDMMRKDISITVDSAGLASTTGTANNMKRPGAFRIGYQGKDPALVARVANRLTVLYVEQNLKTREGQAAGTSEFLMLQLREAKKHLDEMEATVSAYKVEHNGELPQQELSISATLSRLQTELEANRDAINRAQQTRVILEGNLNAIEATISAQVRALEQQAHAGDASTASSGLPDNRGAVSQTITVERLQQVLAVARGRYSESHPEIIALRKQIEALKRVEEQQQASNAEAAAADPKAAAPARQLPLREPPEFARTREQAVGIRAQIMASDKELESRKAEQQRILRDLSLYQKRIERLPLREQQMAQITRDYEISKANYKALVDKRMAADMSLNMERGQQSERFIILDRAQTPGKPIKPDRPKLYAGGLVAALVFALVFGFVTELWQNVLLGEWELPEGTTVLGRLPNIEVPAHPGDAKPKSRGWLRGRKALADISVGLLLAVAWVFTSIGRP